MTIGEPIAKTADQRLVPVTEALALADKYRQSGYLAAAEDLCRQVLEARPTHADALWSSRPSANAAKSTSDGCCEAVGFMKRLQRAAGSNEQAPGKPAQAGATAQS